MSPPWRWRSADELEKGECSKASPEHVKRSVHEAKVRAGTVAMEEDGFDISLCGNVSADCDVAASVSLVSGESNRVRLGRQNLAMGKECGLVVSCVKDLPGRSASSSSVREDGSVPSASQVKSFPESEYFVEFPEDLVPKGDSLKKLMAGYLTEGLKAVSLKREAGDVIESWRSKKMKLFDYSDKPTFAEGKPVMNVGRGKLSKAKKKLIEEQVCKWPNQNFFEVTVQSGEVVRYEEGSWCFTAKRFSSENGLGGWPKSATKDI